MSVKLPLNQPVELALLRTDPKRYPASEGKRPCIMYSVLQVAENNNNTEGKLFLPPSCEASIDHLQLQPGQVFTIVKRKTQDGTEYFELQTSAKWLNSRQLPSSAHAPAPSAAPAPKPVQSASSSSGSAEHSMRSALLAAVDLARDARDYGATRGLDLEFDAEDIRCLAATLFINAAQNSTESVRRTHAA